MRINKSHLQVFSLLFLRKWKKKKKSSLAGVRARYTSNIGKEDSIMNWFLQCVTLSFPWWPNINQFSMNKFFKVSQIRKNIIECLTLEGNFRWTQDITMVSWNSLTMCHTSSSACISVVGVWCMRGCVRVRIFFHFVYMRTKTMEYRRGDFFFFSHLLQQLGPVRIEYMRILY